MLAVRVLDGVDSNNLPDGWRAYRRQRVDREKCFNHFLTGPNDLLDIDGVPTTWFDALFRHGQSSKGSDLSVGVRSLQWKTLLNTFDKLQPLGPKMPGLATETIRRAAAAFAV